MEKMQLDFNAPLLSVRRFSSPSKNSPNQIINHTITEKPLPHRQHSLLITPNRFDWEIEEVVKPAAIPFHWEHTPGRPKTEPQTRAYTPDEPSNTPKLPPARLSDAIRRNSGPTRYNSGEHNVYRPQIEAYDHVTLLEKLNESLNCKDESGSESEEDSYSDALDTLSGSCSFNSGTFSIDSQTRDFMMDRFLPAAKALVMETPQYVVKKPILHNEEPKEIKPCNSQYRDDVESEDEDHDRIIPVKKPKAWGILRIPRFSVKSSLCLLNPLPAMKLNMVKSKSRPPTPSCGDVRRLRRNAHSGPLDKNVCHVPEISTKLTNDSNKSGLLYPLRRDSHISGSVSPYRNETPKSPFREGVGFLGVPKEIETHNANKIASSRKLFKALQDVSRNQINERVSTGPQGEDVEKTLCIDSVVKTYSPISKSSSTKAGSRQIEGYKSIKDTSCPKLNQNVDKESRPLDCNVLVPYDPPVKLPLPPPPLPKSPSESWLWCSGSPLRSRKQGQKGQISETKWETIVKTSNVRPDHVRHSDELMPHVSKANRK